MDTGLPRPAEMIRAEALAVLLVLPYVLEGQPPRLEPGLRVRVTAPTVTAERIIGVLMSQTADTLDVATADRSRRLVPTSTIQQLDVSAGHSRGSRARAGALVGGIGWGVVALIGSKGSGEVTIGHAIGGAAVGLVIGALTGSETWVRVFPPRASG